MSVNKLNFIVNGAGLLHLQKLSELSSINYIIIIILAITIATKTLLPLTIIPSASLGGSFVH